MNQLFSDKIFEILATLHFNPERRYICTEILKEILTAKVNVDIVAKAKAIVLPENTISKPTMFKLYEESFLLHTPDDVDTKDYIANRYFAYNNEFEEAYSIPIWAVYDAANALKELVNRQAANYSFEGISYSNKAEIMDKRLVKIPNESYIQKWKKVFAVNKSKIIDEIKLETENNEKITQKVLFGLDFFLNNFSISPEKLNLDSTIRFQENPLIKLSDDEYVLGFHFCYFDAILRKFEILLRQHKRFREIRGKRFEQMTLSLMKTIEKTTLEPNKPFGQKENQGEIDGILKYNDSAWFIECKSRPPSLTALNGNLEAINSDLKKTIAKAETQIIAASNHLNELNISHETKLGGIIVLEGIYPNFNFLNALLPFPNTLKIPRFIVNYFELKQMLKENNQKFLEFLEWQTQPDNRVWGLTNLDSWAFYNRYSNNAEVMDCSNRLRDIGHHVLYLQNYSKIMDQAQPESDEQFLLIRDPLTDTN